jgi:hypothetical protein
MAQLPSFVLRSLPIITAATPGAFRIFVITFSLFFISSSEAVAFTTQYTLAAFFVMICGIGFSTILVKGMAEDDSVRAFFSYSLSSLVVGGILSLIALFLVSFLLIVPDFFSLLLLVVVTSIYQIFRNYLIFKKDFFKLLVNDVLIGFLFLISILGVCLLNNEVSSSSVFLFLSFAYIISIFIVLAWRIFQGGEVTDNGKVTLIPKDKMISSLVVGMSNAASGGVSFILPSLFAALGGGQIAIVASVAALVFSSIAAVPRGVINNNIAALSNMMLGKVFDKIYVLALRRKVQFIIISLFPLLAFFIFIYMYFFIEVDSFLMSSLFVIALGFYIAAAQLGVVESVMINLCGYERQAFYFNVAVFLGVMAVFLLPNILPAMQSALFIIYLLPVLLGVVNIFRMFWYRQLVGRYFGVEKSLARK